MLIQVGVMGWLHSGRVAAWQLRVANRFPGWGLVSGRVGEGMTLATGAHGRVGTLPIGSGTLWTCLDAMRGM